MNRPSHVRTSNIIILSDISQIASLYYQTCALHVDYDNYSYNIYYTLLILKYGGIYGLVWG